MCRTHTKSIMAEAQLCCLLTWQIRFMLGVGHLCCRLKPAKRLVWKNLFNLWPPGQWGHLPQCQAAISASVWVKVRVRVESPSWEPRALGTLGLENTRGLWQGHNSAACSPCRLVSCMAMSTSTVDPSLLIKKRVGN